MKSFQFSTPWTKTGSIISTYVNWSRPTSALTSISSKKLQLRLLSNRSNETKQVLFLLQLIGRYLGWQTSSWRRWMREWQPREIDWYWKCMIVRIPDHNDDSDTVTLLLDVPIPVPESPDTSPSKAGRRGIKMKTRNVSPALWACKKYFRCSKTRFLFLWTDSS